MAVRWTDLPRQVVVLEMILAYHAFAVSGPDALANPNTVYNDVGSTVSVVRNACTIVLAIISDLIIVCLVPVISYMTVTADQRMQYQVYRTYLVWTGSVFVILVPAGLLLLNVGM